MAGHDVRVSLRRESGIYARPGSIPWAVTKKRAPSTARFSASAVMMLLIACTAVAIVDLILMLGGAG
jgi:hypothetical protein